MRKSKVTIRDVAKAASVHISTASRALNSETQHLITADVVERVRSVARKLDYRANAFASGLRTKRSNAIGLLIPDLWNPAFPAIVAGVQEVVVREGYEITIASDENSSERHATVIESMLSRQVDGLILATAILKDRAITELASRNIPAVMVNWRDEQGRTSSVISDDERGIALAVEHLVSLGHRDICHIGGPQNLSTGVARLRGFVKAMKDHDLKVPDTHVEIAASYSRADGARAAHQLFAQNRRPTAIVVTNDLLALGCYDALRSVGIRCPADISITGYNDMPFVDLVSPPLTTVRQHLFESGRQGALLLMAEIVEREAIPPSLVIQPEIVRRRTTGPRK